MKGRINLIFHGHFLKMDFPVKIPLRPSTSTIQDIQMEGSVSQNLNLGPSLHFIKCSSLHFKKISKDIRFLTSIKTKA